MDTSNSNSAQLNKAISDYKALANSKDTVKTGSSKVNRSKLIENSK